MEGFRVSGPLFDGRADAAAMEATIAIRRSIAEEAAVSAANAISSSVKTSPTGRAESSVVIADSSRTYTTGKYSLPVTVGREETVVTTDLASYGPWLEGTGSRNDTTNFKGYHSFRQAGQEVDAKAEGMAEAVMPPFIGRMNA